MCCVMRSMATMLSSRCQGMMMSAYLQQQGKAGHADEPLAAADALPGSSHHLTDDLLNYAQFECTCRCSHCHNIHVSHATRDFPNLVPFPSPKAGGWGIRSQSNSYEHLIQANSPCRQTVKHSQLYQEQPALEPCSGKLHSPETQASALPAAVSMQTTGQQPAAAA